jgi:non-specific serine/threonine protein kinase
VSPRDERIAEVEGLEENRDNLRRLVAQLCTPVGVVPFVGAGLSVPFGCPGWTDFLRAQAALADISERVQARIEAGEYEEAAEDLLEARGARAFHDAIGNAYGDHKLADKPLEGAASFLPGLAAGPVITTNFDHVLERVFAAAGRPFDRVVPGAKPDLVVGALHGNRRFLLKLHGDVDERSERILTRGEYERHYGSLDPATVDVDRPLPAQLRAVFTARPLLFLGCGLAQDRTVAVLGQMARQLPGLAHYAILGKPAERAEFLRRARFVAENSIVPIWYPTGEHRRVAELLGYLVEQTPPAPRALDRRDRTADPAPAGAPAGTPVGEARGTPPNNLPAELTSFVGRRRELNEVKRLLARTRLLTLTGSGGAGKTRLALRAAVEMARSFPDGVWLVSLASIDDPQLVVQAVLSALGLQDMSPGESMSALSRYLATKHLLLVLDNCEHLLDSCARLAVTLLKSCPDLRVLATSRQGLGTTGETRMRVPPLSLPDDGASLKPEQVATYEAVALLSERAAAVLPGFKVDHANATAVLRLCRRLDGLPLALELAAVRLEGMTVEQVVHGLEKELPVLARGNRGAEARQQTLDATIGWSYGLLDGQERRLWARLSVFAGGFDEAAAVMVCSGSELPPDGVAENLASLVEKSIIQRGPDRQPARYSMLETVRRYGRQRLRELGEEVELQGRHRDWVLQLALAPARDNDREVEAFDRIQLELDNLWGALDFCRRQPGEAAAGVEICRQLFPYWWSRGPLRDVRRLLDAFYPLTAESSVPRGWCLVTMALLAGVQNDAAAQPMAAECLRIGREQDDAELIAWASVAVLFTSLYVQQKSEEELLSLTDAVIDYGRSADRWFAVAIGMSYLCRLRLSQGDLDAAVEAGETSLGMCRQHDELFVRGYALNSLSEARWRRGELDQAEALAREGAAGQHALDSRRGLAQLVETLAWMACDRGADGRAAMLLGYAQTLRESIMLALLPVHRARHQACEQAARGRLGDAAFANAFDRGATLPDGEAIAYVLEQAPAAPAVAPPPPTGSRA